MNTKFDFSIIKSLRRARSISAEELARSANLTRATVVKIENGEGNPTIDTIGAISNVLKLSSSELIRLAEVAECEATSTSLFKKGAFDGSFIQFPDFKLYHLEAGTGKKGKSDPDHMENIFEVCMVISGKIRLTVGIQSHILTPGMAVRFKALHPHDYDVLEDAELLLIHHR